MKTAHVLLWQEHGRWLGNCLEVDAPGEGETLDTCQRAVSRELRHRARLVGLDGRELEEAPDRLHDFHAQERWQRWFRGYAPAAVRSASGFEYLDWLVRDGGER